MRDQYAGDVSDVLKFAFLRALAGADRTLGIAWYYAPGDDGRPDGRHLEWRGEPAWRRLDEKLHTGLTTLPERSIAALERAAIWPPKGSLFHGEPIPPRGERGAWGTRKRSALDDADIVFLDPDTGIGEETEKHATYSEIQLLRKPGRAIVIITFPNRSMKYDAQLQQLHERLAIETRAENIITLRTNVSVPGAPGSRSVVQRPRWFTVVDPDAELAARAKTFFTALKLIPRVSAKLDSVRPALRLDEPHHDGGRSRPPLVAIVDQQGRPHVGQDFRPRGLRSAARDRDQRLDLLVAYGRRLGRVLRWFRALAHLSRPKP
jgi:hypothetical protein